MLTNMLLKSKIDQTFVLATSEEAPPLRVPQGVKFLSLVEGIKPSDALASTAAQPRSFVRAAAPRTMT